MNESCAACSVVVGRDEDHARPPRELSQLARQGYAVAPRQRHVEQDESRPDLVNELPGTLDGAGLGDDPETDTLQQSCCQAAETGIVIDDQDARFHGADHRKRGAPRQVGKTGNSQMATWNEEYGRSP